MVFVRRGNIPPAANNDKNNTNNCKFARSVTFCETLVFIADAGPAHDDRCAWAGLKTCGCVCRPLLSFRRKFLRDISVEALHAFR